MHGAGQHASDAIHARHENIKALSITTKARRIMTRQKMQRADAVQHIKPLSQNLANHVCVSLSMTC
jgi:hypothetical protein